MTDGDDGKVTVKSKNGHTIEIDEKGKKITVSSGDNKQKIILDEGGGKIDLEASKQITMKAESISINGKIALKGQHINITADNDVSIKAKQLKADGTTAKYGGQNTEVKGSTVNVESSGMLTLKGSMTKIN